MPSYDDVDIITAYTANLPTKGFEQDGAGLDETMPVPAEHTKLEAWDENGKPFLKEYEGAGKLKGKIALLTGADSVSQSGFGSDEREKIGSKADVCGGGCCRCCWVFLKRVSVDQLLSCSLEKAPRSRSSVFLKKNKSSSFLLASQKLSIKFLIKRRSGNSAEKVKSMIEGNEYSPNSKVNIIYADLSKKGDGDAPRIIAEHKAAYGERLDILVNNAAQQVSQKDMSKIDMDVVERTFQSVVQSFVGHSMH